MIAMSVAKTPSSGMWVLERNYSRDIGECLNCVTHNVMYCFVNDKQHYEITIMERLL